MNITKEAIVGEIVAQDYRTAAVFKSHGIDFCCKGNRSIEAVSIAKSLSPDSLISELTELQQQTGVATNDYQSWPLDLLADYIEKKHHRYVEATSSQLKQYLAKLCEVHGKQNPELFSIAEQFYASADELAQHMKKEELILFPAIRKMVSAQQNHQKMQAPHFGTVKNPIQMMMQEHDIEGERFRLIEELSNHYTPPQDGCNTYKVTFALLKEFEDDLHQHIHLENNILFPKAIALEKELAQIGSKASEQTSEIYNR